MRLSTRFSSALLAILVLAGCSATPPQPQPAPAPEPAIDAADRAAFEAAVALLRDERYEAAQAAFERLLQETGATVGIHLNLALIHRQAKRYEQALEHTDRALELAPDNPSAHNLRGSLLRQAGDFLSARDAYQQALALKPDYAAAHLNLGILLDIYLKQWPDARHHYQRYQALAKEPDPRVGFWLQDLELRIRGAQL